MSAFEDHSQVTLQDSKTKLYLSAAASSKSLVGVLNQDASTTFELVLSQAAGQDGYGFLRASSSGLFLAGTDSKGSVALVAENPATVADSSAYLFALTAVDPNVTPVLYTIAGFAANSGTLHFQANRFYLGLPVNQDPYELQLNVTVVGTAAPAPAPAPAADPAVAVNAGPVSAGTVTLTPTTVAAGLNDNPPTGDNDGDNVTTSVWIWFAFAVFFFILLLLAAGLAMVVASAAEGRTRLRVKELTNAYITSAGVKFATVAPPVTGVLSSEPLYTLQSPYQAPPTATQTTTVIGPSGSSTSTITGQPVAGPGLGVGLAAAPGASVTVGGYMTQQPNVMYAQPVPARAGGAGVPARAQNQRANLWNAAPNSSLVAGKGGSLTLSNPYTQGPSYRSIRA